MITLEEGRLYAFANAYELDGRPASHPLQASGFVSSNSYLLIEPGHALLIDAGFSVHQDRLMEQLGSLVGASDRLSVWALRIGEFASICNVRPIVERFSVDVLYGSQGKPPIWVDFRPEFVPYGAGVGSGAMGRIEDAVARRGDVLAVGEGGRGVEVLDAPLRLLPTNWAYDAQTRTLFTSDAFTHLWRESEEGPWVATVDDDPGSPEGLASYMLGSRFWWLAGARTEGLRAGIAEIFDSYDVETIAPAFGCVLRGREMVRRHREMLDAFLVAAAEMPSIGLEVGRWTLSRERVQ